MMDEGLKSIVAGIGAGAVIAVDWWLLDAAFRVHTLTPGWLFTCVAGGAVLGPFVLFGVAAIQIWWERRR